MTFRKIKSKERANGMKYCTFCKKEHAGLRKDAIWKQSWTGALACEEHKHLIEDRKDDADLTEADYQTWMRL